MKVSLQVDAASLCHKPDFFSAKVAEPKLRRQLWGKGGIWSKLFINIYVVPLIKENFVSIVCTIMGHIADLFYISLISLVFFV